VKFTIQEIDESGLEKIAPFWTQLCQKCQFITPFQYPQWLIPWWRTVRKSQLKVITFFDGKLLAGVAPFSIYENQKAKKILGFIGSAISGYLDIIVLPGYEHDIACSVMEYLTDIGQQWDECDLREIPESSILLHCKYPDHFKVKKTDCNVCSHLEIPPDMDKLRNRLPEKLRKNLSYSAKNAQHR
jgi:Protein involved in cellulose biosynthesis (CelD)